MVIGILSSIFMLLASVFIYAWTVAGDSRNLGLYIVSALFLLGGSIFPTLVTIRMYTEREKEKLRKIKIHSHKNDWGNEICKFLIAKRIKLEMTKEMAILAWGEPAYADEQETTSKGLRERWVYGQPRKNARYVWFLNDKIVKIKTS